MGQPPTRSPRARPAEGTHEGGTDAWFYEGTQTCTKKTADTIEVTHAGS